MLILAIESSCDETSAAIVDMSSQHRRILSDEIASQIEIHRPYGGVVPEIAGRAHIEAISDLTYRAFASAGLRPEDIDLVGVTNRPGLIGALLVGLNFAKSLAFSFLDFGGGISVEIAPQAIRQPSFPKTTAFRGAASP